MLFLLILQEIGPTICIFIVHYSQTDGGSEFFVLFFVCVCVCVCGGGGGGRVNECSMKTKDVNCVFSLSKVLVR